MTDTFDALSAIVWSEFPDDGDLDTICISSVLTDVIAEALGMEPDVWDEAERVLYENPDGDTFRDEATKVLGALIAKGYLRRSDFTYNPTTNTAERV